MKQLINNGLINVSCESILLITSKFNPHEANEKFVISRIEWGDCKKINGGRKPTRIGIRSML